MLSTESFKRIYLALGIIFIILVGGITGYMLIEGFSFLDSLYMTVITVSTVGYKEVGDLSPSGQVFTIFLIVFSFGVFAYTVSAVTSFFVTGKFQDQLKILKMKNRIDDLNDHVIVCGYGRVGRMACNHLQKHNYEFIVIDESEETCEELKEDGILHLHGNAVEDETLEKAHVKKASALISALPDDAENLFVVVTARELNGTIQIVSRASVDTTEKKLIIGGANNVIMPDKVGGGQMASMVTSPDVFDFVNQISVAGEGNVNLEEIACKDLPDEMKDKTLRELDIRKRFGVNIIGLKSEDGEFVLNPGPDDRLTKHAKIFVLGQRQQIDDLNKELGLN
ncbi:potassium channel family protein [Halocola ammonii]